MARGVFAELHEPERGKPKIRITYQYDPEIVAKLKSLPDTKFVSHEKGGPAFDMMANIANCRLLREAFGERLTLGTKIKPWAAKLIREGRQLRSLSVADTAELELLPDVLPKLYAAIHLGPIGPHLSAADRRKRLRGPASYQAADVAFMARRVNPLNANQPGTGKTFETIGAIYEEGIENGPKLVVAPLSSLDVVWDDTLKTYQDHPVLVAPDSRPEREAMLAQAVKWASAGEPFWFVCTAAMLQFRYDKKADEEYILYPEIHEISWAAAVLDEFHKVGLANLKTGTSRAVNAMKVEKRIALSGTPIGGKPLKLYGALHWLHPKEFTSKWRFVDQFLEKTTDHNGYVKVGGIRQDAEEAFYEEIGKFVVRRTKEECLPWLPPKQYVEIWAKMAGKQKAQYEEFAREAEIYIDEHHLSAVSILAEYTRLKQFADAEQTIIGRDPEGKLLLRPTANSAKLPIVLDLLDERGIRKGEMEGDEQVVIFSQFTQVVDVFVDELNRRGIPAEKITGAVSRAKRTELIRKFQSAEVRVMVMNTTAGGVSITLDNANTVIFLDQTWVPDDQEQAEDRIHRGSRIHQVLCIVIRSSGTVEEYIQEINLDKTAVNYNILDMRRKHQKQIDLAVSK